LCCSKTCSEKRYRFCQKHPDVLVIYARLTDCNSNDIIQGINTFSPHTNIIALCDDESNIQCISAIKAGARACICRDMSPRNVIQVIKLVADGEVIISSNIAGALLEQFRNLLHVKDRLRGGSVDLVSHREAEVLDCVALGLTNREIASELFISEHTVKVHIKNIMRKLHAHNREQAVASVMSLDEPGKLFKMG